VTSDFRRKNHQTKVFERRCPRRKPEAERWKEIVIEQGFGRQSGRQAAEGIADEKGPVAGLKLQRLGRLGLAQLVPGKAHLNIRPLNS
jgi:hypothetical protein